MRDPGTHQGRLAELARLSQAWVCRPENGDEHPDLLVLDEVGVAIGIGAKRRAMLFDVLNARYGEMRPTILIGNLTAAEMDAYLGESVMDRSERTVHNLAKGTRVHPMVERLHRIRGGGAQWNYGSKADSSAGAEARSPPPAAA